ncbi:MAG TPA: patatin-like phospholipase family protein [Gaiellaceae bacterium]|nr:patatin-like phospholipase family protein [Gaiellaceae bacterium]
MSRKAKSKRKRKRALVLAGGGLEVAFQAGVLQVWLDEVEKPLDFGLADGAGGGVFNLAMWCQGMTGTEIADAWRKTRPLSLIAVNLMVWRSLLTYGRFRRNVLRKTWKLDWPAINAAPKPATFNTYNLSKGEPRVFQASELSEDKLIACVSLPTWFEPVRIDGDDYIAALCTGANLEAAIASGATELWVIWTVSTSGRRRNGLFHQYLRAAEAVADSHLDDVRARIKKSNARIADDKEGEFPHRVKVRLLRHEVPIDYVLVLRSKPLHEAVELGVQVARDWCKKHGIKLKEVEAQVPSDVTTLRFTETLSGPFAFGVGDPRAGEAQGKADGTEVRIRVTAHLDGVRRFLADRAHRGRLTGTVHSDALGGERQVDDGTINLFPIASYPGLRKMIYRVDFRDGAGHPLTLHGEKLITKGGLRNVLGETTTLYTRIERGPNDEPVGAGVLRMTLPGLLDELLTFRAWGRPNTLGGMFAGAGYIVRFQAFFLGQLWRVYMSR